MFRSSDKTDNEQLSILLLWETICSIENKTGLMAHEIPGLKDKLQQYQDGKLKRSYFKEYLNKYIDILNKGHET